MRRNVAGPAVLAGLLSLSLVLSGCGGTAAEPGGAVEGVRENNPDGFAAVVLPKPYRLADAKLTATDGSEVELSAQLTRPLTLVFFGYTHCPDICQIIMNDLTAALVRLDDATRDRVRLLFVTSDPERDDPATLREYLSRFDPGWGGVFEGLTGPLDRIKRVASSVGVEITEGDPLPQGGYEVAHGTPVLGVEPDGSVPLVWTQGKTSKEFAADIAKALDEGVPQIGSDP